MADLLVAHTFAATLPSTVFPTTLRPILAAETQQQQVGVVQAQIGTSRRRRMVRRCRSFVHAARRAFASAVLSALCRRCAVLLLRSFVLAAGDSLLVSFPAFVRPSKRFASPAGVLSQHSVRFAHLSSNQVSLVSPATLAHFRSPFLLSRSLASFAPRAVSLITSFTIVRVAASR